MNMEAVAYPRPHHELGVELTSWPQKKGLDGAALQMESARPINALADDRGTLLLEFARVMRFCVRNRREAPYTAAFDAETWWGNVPPLALEMKELSTSTRALRNPLRRGQEIGRKFWLVIATPIFSAASSKSSLRSHHSQYYGC